MTDDTKKYADHLFKLADTNCEKRHIHNNKETREVEKVAESSRDLLIVMTGLDGKSGEWVNMTTRIEKVETEQEKQRAFLIKLAFAVMGASTVGGGIVHFVTRFAGG